MASRGGVIAHPHGWLFDVGESFDHLGRQFRTLRQLSVFLADFRGEVSHGFGKLLEDACKCPIGGYHGIRECNHAALAAFKVLSTRVGYAVSTAVPVFSLPALAVPVTAACDLQPFATFQQVEARDFTGVRR